MVSSCGMSPVNMPAHTNVWAALHMITSQILPFLPFVTRRNYGALAIRVKYRFE